jgi:hypothetical protein
VQQVLEPDPGEELRADAVGHGADDRGAVVDRVDVDSERPRSVRQLDDVDDRRRDCVRDARRQR